MNKINYETPRCQRNKLSPRAVARRHAPRRRQFDSRRIYVRIPHMAKLQTASVPIAQGSCAPTAAAPWDRQTEGRIAASVNAPYGGDITTCLCR